MKTSSSPESLDGSPPEDGRHPSFGEAFRFWLKLGFISFSDLLLRIRRNQPKGSLRLQRRISIS
jgi:hypothetical protein